LALRIEDGVLIGDDRGMPFRFEPLSATETSRRQQTTAAWRDALTTILRNGAVLEGSATDSTKTTRSAVRLRVTNVDTAKSTVEFRLESASAPNLFRMVSGRYYPEAGVLNLVRDVRPNTYGIVRTAQEPWFRGGRDTLNLAIENFVLAGQDGHVWSFEFPVGHGRN